MQPTAMHSTAHPIATPPHHLPSVSIATYLPAHHLAHLHTPRGKLLHTMGHHTTIAPHHTATTQRARVLHMEEALWLLERGLLEMLWDGVPVSVQECYALVEAGGCGGGDGAVGGGLDVYAVYAELKGQGLIVLRPSALFRERRPPEPPPPPPTADSEVQDQSADAGLQATLSDSVVQAKEVEMGLSAQEVPEDFGWAELEWGCDDEQEQSMCAHVSQLISMHNARGETPSPVATTASMSTLPSSLSLFFVWSPSSVGSFRRSAPPRPSCLLVVGGSADNDDWLATALRLPGTVLAVCDRAERELRGVTYVGEHIMEVRGTPVVLGTVKSTRVSYTRSDPILVQAL